jgi:hypothetical protein
MTSNSNIRFTVTVDKPSVELNKALIEFSDSYTVTEYVKEVLNDNYDSTIRVLKSISLSNPSYLIRVSHDTGDGIIRAKYFKDGHYAKADGSVNRSLTRFKIRVTGATKKEMTDIYLRLRVYDFGGNFGVTESNRQSKWLARADRGRIGEAAFKIDVISQKYFKNTIMRLLKKYPSCTFTVIEEQQIDVVESLTRVAATVTTEYRAA